MRWDIRDRSPSLCGALITRQVLDGFRETEVMKCSLLVCFIDISPRDRPYRVKER